MLLFLAGGEVITTHEGLCYQHATVSGSYLDLNEVRRGPCLRGLGLVDERGD